MRQLYPRRQSGKDPFVEKPGEDLKETVPAGSDRLCKSLTKKNKPCKANPTDGSDYCRDHMQKPNIRTSKPDEPDEPESSESSKPYKFFSSLFNWDSKALSQSKPGEGTLISSPVSPVFRTEDIEETDTHREEEEAAKLGEAQVESESVVEPKTEPNIKQDGVNSDGSEKTQKHTVKHLESNTSRADKGGARHFVEGSKSGSFSQETNADGASHDSKDLETKNTQQTDGSDREAIPEEQGNRAVDGGKHQDTENQPDERGHPGQNSVKGDKPGEFEELGVQEVAESSESQSFASDETDDELGPEAMEHLLDVYGVEGSKEDPVDPEDLMESSTNSFLTEAFSSFGGLESFPFQMSEKWNWEDEHEERLNKCWELLDLHDLLLKLLPETIEKEHRRLQRDYADEKVRATARMFEHRRVIGGTIVGCIARLEAIQSGKPFAIVVEEASEVLEPLLFSCFGSSTQKLEMIGDHLQLRPSSNRYDFERINHINISMFERLIRSPQLFQVPTTVLSVQRRMRPSVCDFTRSYYGDITSIEDHEICNTRKIGDFLVKRDFRKKKTAVLNPVLAANGRSVPGIGYHIFLWTSESPQERADVGLSRINRVEARRAAQLTQYLIKNGVPPRSIAVLTPYKGQLMLIRGILQRNGLLPRGKRDPNDRGDAGKQYCIASVVDRFQGDEADIVIVSLVTDGKSRTPFVKLQNRMIVLLSRARLGMYLLGNLSYFEGSNSPHWENTLDQLRTISAVDSVDRHVFEGKVKGSLGKSLPLQCPVHRDSWKLAKNEDELRNDFCRRICKENLNCSHLCGLGCHWPAIEHREVCEVEVVSPCHIHRQSLTCDAFIKKVKRQRTYSIASSVGGSSALTIQSAVTQYRCGEKVHLGLPCGHSENLDCADQKDIVSDKVPWPVCNRNSPVPYRYPVCCHELQCSCEEKKLWSNGISSAPPCVVDTVYTPNCLHVITTKCYLSRMYAENPSSFLCGVEVETQLPRCSHWLRIACSISQLTRRWIGKAINQEQGVQEGVQYGPKDGTCREDMKFIPKCGHTTTIPCEDAFNASMATWNCTVQVEKRHPDCGHGIMVHCRLQLPQPKAVADFITEGQVLPPPHKSKLKCTATVTFKRKCGHEETMSCSDARRGKVRRCENIVKLNNPICSHPCELPCWLLAEALKLQPIEFKDMKLITEDQPSPLQIPSKLKMYLAVCETPVRVERHPCHHVEDMSCAEAVKWLQKKPTERASCAVELDLNRPCLHSQLVKCCDHEAKAKDPCREIVAKPCWNSSRCKNQCEVSCGSEGLPSCSEQTIYECPDRNHELKLNFCERGHPMECPKCSIEQLEADIEQCHAILEQGNMIEVVEGWIQDPPFEPRRFESGEESEENKGLLCLERVTIRESDAKNVVEGRRELLNDFKAWLLEQPLWDRPLYSWEWQCFFRTNGKGVEDSISPARHMTIAAVNGVKVQEWTKKNVAMLAKWKSSDEKRDVSLLCGQGLAVHVMTELPNPPPPPSKGRKKRGKDRQDQQRQEYIASVREESNKKFFRSAQFSSTKDTQDSSVYWQPYVLFATHKLTIRSTALSDFADTLDEKRKLHRERYVSWNKAGELVPKPSSEAPADEVEIQIGDQKLIFPSTWDGCSLILTEVSGREFRPEQAKIMDKELLEKLNFVPPQLKKKASEAVFGGINVLDQFSHLCQVEESPMLRCLELLHLGEEKDRAKQYLLDYAASLQATSSRAHPLTLLAEARIRSDEKGSSERRHLLQMFATTFDIKATKPWLSESELREVSPESSSSNGNLRDAASVQGKQKLRGYEEQWKELKLKEGCSSEAMEDLLQLVGITKVKRAAIQMYKVALNLAKLDNKVRENNQMAFNYLFYGNPGTGKTTVARLLGRILCDAGVRKSDKFVERTAQGVKDGGTTAFRNDVDVNGKDGVLFIDEAYDLDPGGDQNGRKIVMELMCDAENKRHTNSFILAGYEDDMEKKLLSFNVGLRSRFHEVFFEDFNEDELETIFRSEVAKRSILASEEVERVLVKRLARRSGVKGFGNARSVRTAVDKAFQEALLRSEFSVGEPVEILSRDVIGEHPFHNSKLQGILEEIDAKTGWYRVKKSLNELVKMCGENYDRELRGQAPLPVQMNRLFLGNPGTGKTTCARLYGRLLKQLGFLSNGEVVMRAASDLMGQYVGESTQKTKTVIESAKGKVLVIDEAYGLDDNLYGKQALDTIVEKVQGQENDDIAVVLIGYEKQMMQMLRKQNPGLARRFGRDYAFWFDDYTEVELLKIFHNYREAKGVQVESVEVAQAALKILEKQKAFSNFGNAGAVELLVKGAIAKAGMRPRDDHESGQLVLIPSDLDQGVKDENDPLAALEGLYRMESVREALIQIQNNFLVAEKEGSKPPELGHFVFRGPPGTGKTTVARAMAKILHKLGVLASDRLKETSGLELTGEYIGQTKTKVKEQLDEAKGGILFIDEAYELGKGPYGEEAMTSLVAAMTDDEYKGLAIIIAGYPKDMDDMLDRNAGLKSRFTRFFEFPCWGVEDAVEFFSSFADREGFTMSEDVIESLRCGFEELVQYPGWGSGRDVNKVWKMSIEARAARIMRSEPETFKTLTVKDVQVALERRSEAIRPVAGQNLAAPTASPVPMEQSKPRFDAEETARKRPPAHEEREEEKQDILLPEPVDAEKEEEGEEAEEEDEWGFNTPRDAGVPDDVWEELQRAKDKLRAEVEELTRNIEDEEARVRLEKMKKERERRRRLLKCPAGYIWYECAGGYLCAAGGHFVSEETLQAQFMVDA